MMIIILLRTVLRSSTPKCVLRFFAIIQDSNRIVMRILRVILGI
nr:MAG TPA: hypothetical protein [Caudoviricetes sp.]